MEVNNRDRSATYRASIQISHSITLILCKLSNRSFDNSNDEGEAFNISVHFLNPANHCYFLFLY